MDRLMLQEEHQEYLANVAVAAIYNVNRTSRQQKFFQPEDFMRIRRNRAAAAPRHAPAQGMRPAKPGERPPSKYASGTDDGVIDRFDAYARRLKGHG